MISIALAEQYNFVDNVCKVCIRGHDKIAIA